MRTSAMAKNTKGVEERRIIKPIESDKVIKAISEAVEAAESELIWPASELKHDWGIIHKFFRRIGSEREEAKVLVTLEASFKSFSEKYKRYFPHLKPKSAFNEWKQKHSETDKQWFAQFEIDTRTNSNELIFPFILPIPTNHGECSRIQQPGLSTDNILILFFYNELTRYGVFRADVSLDSQIMYATNMVSSRFLERKMCGGNLFVDIGSGAPLGHGKYTHLLQLTLLCYAIEDELITLKILNRKNMVEMLVSTIGPRGYNYWQLLLDGVCKSTTDGPNGLMLIMLSDFARNKCSNFYYYWYLSYIKKLIKKCKFTGSYYSQITTLVKQSQFEVEIKKELLNPSTFADSHALWQESWLRKYRPKRVSLFRRNLFYKENKIRSKDFKNVERSISTAPNNLSSPNHWYSRLFDCIKKERNDYDVTQE